VDISVIGLGKLGAPLAAVLAGKGHTVIGVDVNEQFVNAINEGRAPVVEPGLDEAIRSAHPRLTATTDGCRRPRARSWAGCSSRPTGTPRRPRCRR